MKDDADEAARRADGVESFYKTVAWNPHRCHPGKRIIKVVKKKFTTISTHGLGLLLLCAPGISRADETNFPYAAISRRNVFALVAAPPAANFPPPPAAPMTRLKLTGLASLPPDKWALLQIQEEGAAPFSATLLEGESKGAVRLVSINITDATAMVSNGAVLTELALEEIGGRNVPVAAPTQLAAEHLPIPVLPPPGIGDP